MARPGILAALQSAGFAIVTEGSSDPRDVMARLLGALAELAPEAHRKLTAGGSLPTWLPPEALDDELHQFWALPAAEDGISELMRALDAAAPAGYRFGFEGSFWRLGFFRLPEAP